MNKSTSLSENLNATMTCYPDNTTDTTWGYQDSISGNILWVNPSNYYYEWYPLPYPSYITIDKTKQAFEIVKLLKEKKLAKITTVKQFVELVDEIVKVL